LFPDGKRKEEKGRKKQRKARGKEGKGDVHPLRARARERVKEKKKEIRHFIYYPPTEGKRPYLPRRGKERRRRGNIRIEGASRKRPP